jgi:hypothetical protein
VTNFLVGKRLEASRQLGWGDSNSTSSVSSIRGRCPLLPAVVRGSPVGCGPSTDRRVLIPPGRRTPSALRSSAISWRLEFRAGPVAPLRLDYGADRAS